MMLRFVPIKAQFSSMQSLRRVMICILVSCFASACTTLPGVLGNVGDNNENASRSRINTLSGDNLSKAILAQPVGGENTISLSLANCFNCPLVNILVDPDGYWQRSEQDGIVTGNAGPGLYNSLAQSFAAGGLYNWPEQTIILPSMQDHCPQYAGEGQLFIIAIALGGERRRVIFDAGCAGSEYAANVVRAINAVSGIEAFQNIVSGKAQAREISSPEPRAVPKRNAGTSLTSAYPNPPSLKPWGG